MARRNIIEILLTSKDQATPNIKVLGLSLTDLKSGIDLVSSTAQKMAQAVEAAFDFTEEGAAILQTRDSFDRLGVSIEAMRDVSLGTVDDMTLMSSTLTLTAGASEQLQAQLLQNAPQLLEIAKASNALNPTLGDTAHMYNSIATGIKRASPLILDNLGIVVKIGEANAVYAAQLGKTVEALTAEEKQIALLNATILAGNRLIEQSGGTVESYTDAWARMRAEMKNATDAAKAFLAGGIGPLITRYADFLMATRENENALIGFSAALRFSATMLGMNAEEAQELGKQSDILTGNLFGAEDAVRAYRDGLEGTSKTTEHTADAQKNLNKELQEGISILEQMRAESGRGRVLVSSLAEHQQDLAWKLGDSAAAWDQYNTAMQQATDNSGLSVRALEELAEQARIAGERVEGIKWSTAQTLTEQLKSGQEQIAGLRDRAGELMGKIAELEGMSYRTPAQETQLSDLRGQLGDVRGDIDNVIEGMREMSARFVLGLIEMKIAVDGKITEAEAAFLAGYARQAGLIDDLAVRQSAVVTEAVDNINSGAMDATEALGWVGDETNELVDDFAGLGDSAGRSLDGVGSSVGDVRAQLLGIPGDVAAAQGAIDGMKGKDIEVKIKFKVDRIPTVGGGVTHKDALLELEGLSQAQGGDFIVSQPTPFIAGDAGPERAIFIPQGQPGFSGSGATGAGGTRIENLTLNVTGTADAHETARLVMAEFQGRGLMPQRPMR